MIRSQFNVKRLILVAGDLVILEASLLLTLLIRYGNLKDWPLHVWPFTILACLWIVGFYVAGLYDLAIGQETMKLFRTYLEGMIGNLIVAVAFFYLFPFFGIAPRANLVIYFAVSLLLGYAWRILFHRTITEHFRRGRVLFLGPGQEARQVYTLLKTSGLGLDLVAAIPTQGEADPALPIRWVEDVRRFDEVLREEKIQAVVLGVRLDDVPEVTKTLYQMLFSPLLILDRAEVEEVTTGRIPLTYVNRAWFLHHLHESEKAWYESAKRSLDVLLAIPFAGLTVLLFPLVTILTTLSSHGPIFYSQVRVGRGGKNIRIWKFRTMRLDAEKDGPQFTPSTATDPRVTRVGKLLRQLRIDELPQIWNVLRGDLSFIGPRPERPEFVSPLVDRMPYYTLRHLTRPGLTGWAQVCFLTPTSSLEDNLKKLQYDLYYIKHRSLLLDLAILLRTIGIVIRRQGT